MFLLAVSIYALFLVAYSVFVWAIIFHMKKYRTRDESYSKTIKAFALIIIFLIILSFIAFIKVPWNTFA